MATYVLAKQFTTISVTTTGDTVTTRGEFVKVKNLGANIVSYSESSSPTGAVTAGNQSSINPTPATGLPDSVILRPYTTYYVKAATGATLCGFEETWALKPPTE
jgi:hypothetical protein